MLDIKGTLVTIDAMACQTNIAKAIVEQGGDYLLAVKSNQGKLRQAIEIAFSSQRANVADDLSIEQGHGRVESRLCYVFDSTRLEGNFSGWKGLKSIVMVENFRLEKGKSVELEYRYYISSTQLSAEQAACAVREHWGIESMQINYRPRKCLDFKQPAIVFKEIALAA